VRLARLLKVERQEKPGRALKAFQAAIDQVIEELGIKPGAGLVFPPHPSPAFLLRESAGKTTGRGMHPARIYTIQRAG
jgi:thiamine phosphate synthase YjbQ (UPF0047 family)